MNAPQRIEQDADYYQTIEEFFVARRGAPLMLSSADWVLVRTWRRAGIPLRVVLRGIADALDGHAHSWARGQKVMHLRFCAQEVEVARERWRRALSGAPGGDDQEAQGVLAGLATALEQAAGLGRAGPAVARLARELRDRAGVGEPRAEIESWLVSAERSLVKALGRALGAQSLNRLEAQVQADLEPYRERLPERILEQVHGESLTRRLFEHFGLPRLSLVPD